MPIQVETVLSDQDEMSLRLGLLLYSGRDGVLATIHKVDAGDGQQAAVLLPGECLELSQLQALNNRLSERVCTRQLLPAEVLVADQDVVIWHRPAQRRVIFFETGMKAFDAAINGKMALHPALLFVARRKRIQVFALDTNKRPALDTPLLRAPYLNVHAIGLVCVGTAPVPDQPLATPDSILAYEKTFFESSFSHTAVGDRELTAYADGHNALWKMLVETDCPDFPVKTLHRAMKPPKNTPMTLGVLLEGEKK